MRFAYYPGCAVKGSSRFYERSIMKVLAYFDITLAQIEGWSCCGATAVRAVDRELADRLVATNIALAEAMNLHMFTPCSACFNRMKTVNDRMRNVRDIRDRVNRSISPLRCEGSTEIRSILDVFLAYVGLERIAASVLFDLSSLSVVPYYGCMLTRLPQGLAGDDHEDPSAMDILLRGLGCDVRSWPFKGECCGGSKTIVDPEVTHDLSAKIMERAVMEGARAIITSCPLCQMNLDLLPHTGPVTRLLPVLFISEVFELALFGTLSGKAKHFIPPGAVGKARAIGMAGPKGAR